jgi:hypothetical protein
VTLSKELTKLDVTIAAQTLLNGALDEDTLDDGWVSVMNLEMMPSFNHGI